jgi:hypothetical protein
MSFGIRQTGLPKRFQGISQGISQAGQPGAHASAGSVADAQLLDQFSTMQPALQQVIDRLSAAVQLHLAERGDVRQQRTGPLQRRSRAMAFANRTP